MADDENKAGEGHNGPDFNLARDIMRDDIAGIRDDLSKRQGDASAAWKRVEKEAGVHKGAAKAVFGLLNKSEEHRDDFLRSFVGLARAFGLTTRVDLVDLAQGGTGFKPGGMPGSESGLPTTDVDETDDAE